MGLSSNTLIHFTKTLKALTGILTENFKIRYCNETIYSKSDHLDLIIPIVSFCDIPFSQIINHIDNYGCYGIGLKKEWAEVNGLNPVLYIDKNASLSDNIIMYSKSNLIPTTKSNIHELSDTEKYSLDFIRYLKNYQGDLIRAGKKEIKNYRFSDEREWRFTLDAKLEYPLFGNAKKLKREDMPRAKEIYNKKVENERLKFSPEDVNYIIIKNEFERDKIINTLEKVNGNMHMNKLKD